MIELATRVEPIPVEDEFPEDLENDNKQSDESDDCLSEQEQAKRED